MTPLLPLFILLLTSCSSSPTPSPNALKKQNQKGEYLYRKHGESLFTIAPPLPSPSAPYPWEKEEHLPTITQDYFKCKGSHLNPERLVQEGGTLRRYYDCGGAEKHSLPLHGGKEAIYPILIDLINYIQSKTNKRVVITSGHRCPEHNLYLDSSKENECSKHTIGAEVSFYVQGMEEDPDAVVQLLTAYYKEEGRYRQERAYTEFHPYQKAPLKKAPLFNKEIFIKVFDKEEGRNFDNRHPYPYISVQVRHDRDKNQKVVYSWEAAHRNIIHF